MIEMLYKKKIIRDFLSLFTENYWKQLVSSILEYGIINFKKHHSIASLTPEDILNIVESLKKDENLGEKKKTNLIINRDNIKPNKPKEINTNVSRSRSKSIGNNNFKKYGDKTKENKESSILKSSITDKQSGKQLTTSSVEKSNHFKNNVGKLVNRTQTPSKNKLDFMNTGNNLKKFHKSSSSQEELKISNANTNKLKNSKSGTKNIKKISSNIKINNSAKKENSSSVNTSNISNLQHSFSKNNIKQIKKKKYVINTESDNESDIINSTRSPRIIKKTDVSNISTASNKPQKKKTQILEKAHLEKLKQKKKGLNENLVSDEENCLNNSTKNKISNSKVESKIKNAIQNDKKIYNIMKSQEQRVEPLIENTNTPLDSPKQKDKFIGDGISFSRPYATSSIQNKSSIHLLEEKLNGLSQKISKAENSCTYKNEDLNKEAEKENYSSNKLGILGDTKDAKHNKTSEIQTNTCNSTNYFENFTKYKISDMDEDYIAEEQVDLNKYNYLYNYNDTDEYSRNYQDDLEE